MRTVIGLDFDGPIHDIDRLKGLLAFQLYKLQIEGHLLNSDIVRAGKVPITMDQYREIQKLAYSDDTDVLAMMQPTPYVIEGIHQLLDRNHRIVILTARQETALAVAKDKLRQWGFNLDFYGIGYGVSKRETIEELRLSGYVDDDLEVLEKVRGVATPLYLFHPHIASPYQDIKQVPNWPCLLAELFVSLE